MLECECCARQCLSGRQTSAKTAPGERNGFFDSKVLSRQHAEVWEEAEKVHLFCSRFISTLISVRSDIHQSRQKLQRYIHQQRVPQRRGCRVRPLRAQDRRYRGASLFPSSCLPSPPIRLLPRNSALISWVKTTRRSSTTRSPHASSALSRSKMRRPQPAQNNISPVRPWSVSPLGLLPQPPPPMPHSTLLLHKALPVSLSAEASCNSKASALSTACAVTCAPPARAASPSTISLPAFKTSSRSPERLERILTPSRAW